MLTVFPLVAAAALPPFSWDHVPTYAFCAPIGHMWNASELSWLNGSAGSSFAPRPQWLAMGYVTGANLPPENRRTEEKQTAWARVLADAVPGLPIWWGTAWGVFPKMFDVGDWFVDHPNLLLHCNGSVVSPPVMDWGQEEARRVWSRFFMNMTDGGGDGRGLPSPFSGVLVDGIGPLVPPYDRAKAGYNIYANPNCS
eukprot:Hpha_TRINITY_DN981_c0_g1::TRINITY_DN981_c0_g1_i1::g.156188::m.156188